MSFMQNLFGKAPTQAPAQQAPAPVQPGNLQTAAQVQAQSTEVVGGAQAPAPGSAAINTTNPDSPLSKFEGMWETNTDTSKNPATPDPTQLNLSADKLQQIVSGTNFAEKLDPQTLAAISAGGEAAQQALAQALNQVAQQVFVQSTMVNSKLTGQQIQAAIAAELSKLPQAMRSQAVSDHMQTANPLFNNPAIKPVADAAREQLMAKHPNATQAEITEMVTNYLGAMGTMFNPQQAQQSSAPAEQDWSNYLQGM